MSKLIMSPSPHFFSGNTTQRIMLDVIIALAPAMVASVINYGLRSLLVITVCVAVCVLAEWIFEKICKKENTISDLSAVVTGILLAFNLPVSIPIWQAVVGCLVAIVIVKQLFGGIGQNFANPAITARVVMLTAFSGSMTTWTFPDAVTGATPLALISKGETDALPSYLDMFLGRHGGCLGETCILALLLGGIYLLVRRVISWHTPVAFIGTGNILEDHPMKVRKTPVTIVFGEPIETKELSIADRKLLHQRVEDAVAGMYQQYAPDKWKGGERRENG